MTTRTPRVSVCLPVYNGEAFIREAVRSVLDQSLQDFELIISDNASTDRTSEICREVAARDPRVRYSRAPVNRGLAWNHNQAFRLSRAGFVMWMGHDDVLAPDYLARCVQTLDQDPGAVVCYTNATHVDEDGRLIRTLDLVNPATSPRPSRRFQGALYAHVESAVYGLMRRRMLAQTALHGGFAGSDRILLAEMALRGRFSLLPQPLLARRYHESKITERYRDTRERTAIFDPATAGKVIFPEVIQVKALLSAIERSRLNVGERLRCYKHLLGSLCLFRNLLVQDIRIGLAQLARKHLL